MLEGHRWGGSSPDGIEGRSRHPSEEALSIKDRTYDLLALWQRFEQESDLSVCAALHELEIEIAGQDCRDLDDFEVLLVLVAAYADYLDDAEPCDATQALCRLADATLKGIAQLRDRLEARSERDSSLDELRRICLAREAHRTQA